MKVTLALAAVAAIPMATAAPTAGDPGHHKGKPDPKYPGLDVLAKKAGLMYFGTAIDNVVLNDTRYTSIAYNKREFGQTTPSNGQKFMYTEPARGVFNFTMADEIIVPSSKAGQMHRCHAFVWHNQQPDWLTQGTWTKAELIQILENHIKNEARHYYKECYAWDVVNEAFEDDGSLRKTIWLDTIGPEYLDLAFKFARKYTSPKTQLYYNDYGIERINNKSLAVAEMVKDFQKRRIPITGVGLQAHFTIGRAPNYTEVSNTLNMFGKLRMETALTELDVRLDLPDSEEKQARQAVVYTEAVQACVDAKSCVGVTVWDFWDPVSWVPATFPGFGNACLWDDDLKKKPAYYAISDMLRAKAKKGKGH